MIFLGKACLDQELDFRFQVLWSISARKDLSSYKREVNIVSHIEGVIKPWSLHLSNEG